jgi:hypothetical protein
LIRTHEVVVNIRTASVRNEIGVIGLELEGPPENIEVARKWLADQGVQIEPVELNVIE